MEQEQAHPGKQKGHPSGSIVLFVASSAVTLLIPCVLAVAGHIVTPLLLLFSTDHCPMLLPLPLLAPSAWAAGHTVRHNKPRPIRIMPLLLECPWWPQS